MVEVFYESLFEKRIKRIRDELLKIKVRKQISKIIQNPEIGKPMRYSRKDTREVYVSPLRLSYLYTKSENKILFLDLYYKDHQ